MIIAVDPGKTGAIAVVDGPLLLDVCDMPITEKEIDPAKLGDIINLFSISYGCDQMIVERVAARPRQGVVSTFNFGVSFGIVKGVAGAFAIDTEYVTPQKWKKDLQLSSDKDHSRMMAMELWPDARERFARKKDDGRAEAALIGYWKEITDELQFASGLS